MRDASNIISFDVLALPYVLLSLINITLYIGVINVVYAYDNNLHLCARLAGNLDLSVNGMNIYPSSKNYYK